MQNRQSMYILSIKSIITVFLISLLSFVYSNIAYSQEIHPENIIRVGVEDSQTLLNEYLKPFRVGFGIGLNSGWQTSPKPHQKYGFDLRVTSTAALVPFKDMIFNVDNLDLQNLQLLDGPRSTPTLFGRDITSARLGSYYTDPSTGQTEELFDFEMPSGLDFRYVITPMAQLTIGLIKDTDITIRFLPTLTIEDDLNFGIWGFGIQHGINQWYNPTDDLLDISVQVGYTSVNSKLNIEVEPEFDPEQENSFSDDHWTGQNTEFQSYGFTANLLAGRQYRFFTIYGGLGVQTSGTIIKANGAYPFVEPINQSDYTPGGPTKKITSLEDPYELKMMNRVKPNVLIGARVRVAMIAISISYSFSEYQSLNAGVGISFR